MRLITESLACRRGPRLLFEGLSIDLGPAEALAVAGANGTGKSSLLRILAGLLPAEAGTVRLADLPTESEPQEAIHYLGHSEAVKPSLTVLEIARFWQDQLGGSAPLEHALERVGIAQLEEVPAGYLSAGQRRRLALARFIASPRPLWLLDEPTTSLDASGLELVARLIAEHRSGGGIVVAASHVPVGLVGAKMLTLGSE